LDLLRENHTIMTTTNIIACIFLFFVLPLEGPVLIDGDPPGTQNNLASIEDNSEKLKQMIELAEQALKKKKSFPVAVEMVKKAFALTKDNHMKVPYKLNWLQAKVAFQKGNIYLAEAAMEKTLKQLRHSGEIKAIIKA